MPGRSGSNAGNRPIQKNAEALRIAEIR